jgi:hypothetical protein
VQASVQRCATPEHVANEGDLLIA